MKRLLAAFARNTVFANIVLVLIFISGGMAAKLMIREIFPELALDMIIISVPYPGADPEEVEEGISRKIEEVLEGMEGVKQYTTQSHENLSSTTIEVKENYDVDNVLETVRSEITAISNFPLDAEKPVIQELIVKEAVVVLYLSGNMSERRLKEWAEKTKDDIQQIPKISQVRVMGVRDYEIAIEISEEKLREYGLTLAQVADAIRKSNLNLGGGTIRSRKEEIRVRTIGRRYTGEELASIVVLAQPEGDIITLGRLAKIHDAFTEDPILATVNGKRAALIIVSKTNEEDSLVISSAVKNFVEKRRKTLPEETHLNVLYDITDMLRDRINLLTKNGLLGLTLVFALLWVFLDHRLSFWGGMGIPVSIAGALAIMWFLGETINMISLFALIMVLGIVVDDAIVVGEAIYYHRSVGQPALQASVEGVCEVGLPVVAAVITTIVAFLPLAFIGGVMGKFIYILPVVVIACLSISLVECLLLLPAHLSDLPDPTAPVRTRNPIRRFVGKCQNMTARGLEWFVENTYKPFLSRCLHFRYISFAVAICVLLLVIGMQKGGILKFETLPEIDGFIVNANVEFPNGTPPEVTRAAVERIEQALMRLNKRMKTVSKDPMLVDRLTFVGTTLGEIPERGPHVGGVQAVLLESEKRGIHSKDIMVAWEKETGKIPGVKALTFEGMQAGPPGAPIEIWIQGRHLREILDASEDLMQRLGEFEGVYQIRSDFSQGKRELRFSLKPEARTLGITVQDLAAQIYAGYYGEEAVRLQRGRDDIRVKVRYSSDERRQISDLENIRIRSRTGHQVPLLSIAEVEFTNGYSTITRTDGMRRVTVSAAVDTHRANANEILTNLSETYFPDLKSRFPEIVVSLQGEKKKMRESISSLYVGFPLALLGIFIIIATMFRSYVQPFVIMFTVPFGLIGAFLGHLLLGYKLSLMSVFGMVALTGVVVNDAIVLIERINENLAEGMRYFDAVLSGGTRRFRAILLTTLSTVGGLMPLIMETDLQAKFLIPMAISIAAGVLFATVLTLVLIPSLLTIFNDFRLLIHWIAHGRWVKRETVEPATERYSVMLEKG